MSRADRQLPEPVRDLGDFPRRTLPRGTVLYRSHSVTNGPWWYASAQPEPDDGGRFDLPDPDGTCYVALDADTALRERLGEEIIRSGLVMAADVATTTISRLALPDDVNAADAAAPAAANWVTRELGSMDDYALAQRWAVALFDAGCEGLVYQSRFTTGAEQYAVALFGDAGTRPWPVDGAEDVRTLLGAAGIAVAKPRRRAALTTSTRRRPLATR